MAKIRIKIIKIGTQLHNDVFEKLTKYESALFCIEMEEIARPNCDLKWGFKFKTLAALIQKTFDSDKSDLCIGFIDTELERNYFSKRLCDYNIFVASFYEIDKILAAHNLDLLNYVLLIIYRCAIRFKMRAKIVHDETKGCLFDMCGMKEDIIYSCTNAIICEDCSIMIRTKGCHEELLNTIKREISKIKKSSYYRIREFIEKYPWWVLLLGISVSIVINLISSAIFQFITKC